MIKRSISKNKRRNKAVKPKEIIKTTPFIEPKHKLLSIDWFDYKDVPEVSIIVPLYNSSAEIIDQIKSWDLKSQIKSEIIYVNDFCPQNSYAKVISAWAGKKEIGKIILNESNGGFGFSCNTGANYARGEYLIFLNADTTVTEGWIEPILDLLKNPTIGIVGNLQVKKGKIDSAGSEWSWRSSSFEHIGRNIYHGETLHGGIELSKMPDDLKHVAEREMVTGCCFGISRRLFLDLQGFDTAYRIGYWEDADLNLRVRARGLKVFFTPQSKIYHKVGHSKGSSNILVSNNKKIFEEKWIATGRLDNFIKNKSKKPIGSLSSNKPFKILAYALDQQNPYYETCKKSLEGFVDEWKDPKCISPDDWLMILDGTEYFREEHLWTILDLMKKYDVIIPQYWMFWNNLNTIGTGGWNKFSERFVKWRNGYKIQNNKIVDKLGNGVTAVYRTWKGKTKLGYNFKWTTNIEEQIKNQFPNINVSKYMNDVYLKWQSNPEEVKDTHPLAKGSWEPFQGILPINNI